MAILHLKIMKPAIQVLLVSIFSVITNAEVTHTDTAEYEQANDIAERFRFEKDVANNPFAILPHKPNYLLPFTYARQNKTAYQKLSKNLELDNVEAEFQISLKFLAAENFLVDDLNVQLAFTSVSWWQTYNSELSAPFRETNYEPEVIFSYSRPWYLFSLPIRHSFIALNHQSNGQSVTLSRSWNRIKGGIVFEQSPLIFSLQSWWRIPEDRKSDDSDVDGDDNPHIEKYLGYGSLGILWKMPKSHNLDIQIRNNLRSDNKGSLKLGWSFPFTKQLRAYVQYFNGYGESLIYYDKPIVRYGIGVKLTDWL